MSNLPQPQATLELRLLGVASFWLDGEPLPQPFGKITALLAYLALEGPQPRAKVAQLLWGDLEGPAARRNLRLVLHRLKEKSPLLYERIEQKGETLTLKPPWVCDALGAGAQTQRGLLLDGLELDKASDFEDWLEARRNQLAEQRHKAQLSQIEKLENSGQLHGALELHLSILAEDNLQEHHQHQAMRLQYRLGQREAALERFAQFKTALMRELGLEPLPETLELAQQIQGSQTLASPSKTPVATLTLPSASPLVGRKEVWEQLEAAWTNGQIILISGEPGIGKSRLMQDFAAAKGRYRLSSGWPTDAGVPFATGSRTVRSLLALKPNLILPNWVRQELARVIPELGEAAPNSEGGRIRLHEAFSELLLLSLDDCPVLVWDDLQFFDLFSLEVGLYAAQRLSNHKRVMLAYRRGELKLEHQTLLQQMVTAGQAVGVELGALSQADLHQLVQAVTASSDKQFSQRLHQATGGNPFFALETLKALSDQGLGWQTRAELPIPSSVRETVMNRVKHLGPEVRRLLEAASLASDGFALETLSGATALSEWESLLALERALQARLVKAEGVVYRFAHDLIRKALQDNLSAERKKLLHRKLAGSLEQLQGSAAKIAEHLELGGKASEAVQWRIRAGEQATRIYAYTEALQQYQQALLDGPSDAQAVSIHQARIANLEALHDLEGRLLEIEQMAKLVARMEDGALKFDVALQASRYYSALGRYTEAIGWAEQALSLLALQESQRLSALHRLGIDLLLMNRLGESRTRLEQALEVARQIAPRRLPQLHDTLCNNALFSGEMQLAAQHSHQSLASVQAGDLFSEAVALSTGARVARALGDYAGALKATEQAIAKAKEQNHLRLLDRFLTNHLTLLVEMGQAEAAGEKLREWLALFPEPRESTVEGRFQERYSDYLILRGELGAAIEAARRGIELADQVVQINQQLYRRPNLARLLNQLGDAGEARRVLESFPHTVPTQPAHIELRYFAELAHCMLQEGNAQAALEALKALPHHWRQAEQGALMLVYLGQCHLALGNPQAALEAVCDLSPATLQLRVSALGVRLEATYRLGLSVEPLQAEARRLVGAGTVPPLEGLELGRALVGSGSVELRSEFKRMLGRLEGSLRNYPLLKERFLHRHRGWFE